MPEAFEEARFNLLRNGDKIRSMAGVDQAIIVVLVMLKVAVQLTMVDPHVRCLL